MDQLSLDSVAEVRAAVYEGFEHLLPCAPALNSTHQALKIITKRGINDKSERVRLAAFKMLNKLHGHRFIKVINCCESLGFYTFFTGYFEFSFPMCSHYPNVCADWTLSTRPRSRPRLFACCTVHSVREGWKALTGWSASSASILCAKNRGKRHSISTDWCSR